jgi:hypothetical protein
VTVAPGDISYVVQRCDSEIDDKYSEVCICMCVYVLDTLHLYISIPLYLYTL